MATDDELRDDSTNQEFNADDRAEETRRNTDANPEDVREDTGTSQRDSDESDYDADNY